MPSLMLFFVPESVSLFCRQVWDISEVISHAWSMVPWAPSAFPCPLTGHHFWLHAHKRLAAGLHLTCILQPTQSPGKALQRAGVEVMHAMGYPSSLNYSMLTEAQTRLLAGKRLRVPQIGMMIMFALFSCKFGPRGHRNYSIPDPEPFYHSCRPRRHLSGDMPDDVKALGLKYLNKFPGLEKQKKQKRQVKPSVSQMPSQAP